MSAPHGPYETEDDARMIPAVRAVYEASRASMRRGVMDELNERMLGEACEAAGVELGAYDRRILAWLAQYEPQACAVLAGLIARAAASRTGAAAAAESAPGGDQAAAQLAEIRRVLDVFDWATDDRRYALEQIDDIASRGQS